jgi:D(-)-tartrate dehydratase
MRIVDIREKTISLAAPMRNAAVGFGGMTASAVAIVSDTVRNGRPLVGLAFDSIGRYGHGGLLRERFMPRLLAADPADYADAGSGGIDPAKVFAVVMRDEKPGGHGERPGAVGLIDAAVWDLVAKADDKPLWRVLADRFQGGRALADVPVYASGGHYRPHDDLRLLQDELRGYLALGYTRMKIKIGGAASIADDLRRVEAALAILGRGDRLAVDFNGTLTRDRAVAYAEALAPYGLAWIEEPVDPLDFELHREVRQAMTMPLATGENIFSAADTRNLLRYAGLRAGTDLLQMDISLSYGLVEYLRILDIAEQSGWSRRQFVPHAGHLLALHAVAGLGLGVHEAAPDDKLLFGGFPEGVTVDNGHVRPPDTPGVGIEGKRNLYAAFRDLVD